MTSQEPRGAAAIAAATAGQALSVFFRILKFARPVRPIHPAGLALDGELVRAGSPAEPSGLEWLDFPGTDSVQARFSRSLGLPPGLPDILGLALRATPSQGPSQGRPAAGAGKGEEGGEPVEPNCADVLFSSTGWRLPGRFLLVPKLDADRAAFTTLMPYQGQRGPVLLALRTTSFPQGSLQGGTLESESLTDDDWVLELYWAKPTGPWRPCGELRLRASPQPRDSPLRFNPLQNQPPGARIYPWTRLLREPSYRVAQQPVHPPR